MSCSRAESTQQREREGAARALSCRELCSALSSPFLPLASCIGSLPPSFPVSSSARRLALAKSSLLWGHCVHCIRIRIRIRIHVRVVSTALQPAEHAVVVGVDAGVWCTQIWAGTMVARPDSDLATLTSIFAMVYRAEAGTVISPLLCDGDWSLGGGEASRRKLVSCRVLARGAVLLPAALWGRLCSGPGIGGGEGAVANEDCMDGWRAERRVGLSCKSVAPSSPSQGRSLGRGGAQRAVMCDNDVGLGVSLRGAPERESMAQVLPRTLATPHKHTAPSRYGYGQINASASTSASPPTSPSIHPSSSSALPLSSPSAPSHSVTEHSGGRAIWSRRPAHAPGVTSPYGDGPPSDVVASARAGGTPLPSPPPVPVERGSGKKKVGRMEEPELEDTAADADADADTPSSSTDCADPRATGTRATTATTVPGSPLSSATFTSVSKAAEPAPAPTASTSASSPSPDAAPAALPPKKTWASLLRLAASPAASTAVAASPQNVRLHALLGKAEFGVAAGARTMGEEGKGCWDQRCSCARWGLFLRGFIMNVSAKKPVNGGAGGKGKGKVSPAEEQEQEPEAFIPTHIYDALKGKKRFDGIRGGHQEDAEEFLGFFPDTLEDELSRPLAYKSAKRRRPPETEKGWLEVGRKNRTVVMRTVKSAESPITRIFGGRFRSTLRRSGIHTIADALVLISHPQTVQMSHPSPPGILRFCYDMAVGGVVEVGKRVVFGPELEVGNGASLFKFSFDTRSALMCSSGTLDVLHPTRFPGSATGSGSEREGWVRIDDELVSDVRPVDVFGAPEGNSRESTEASRAARGHLENVLLILDLLHDALDAPSAAPDGCLARLDTVTLAPPIALTRGHRTLPPRTCTTPAPRTPVARHSTLSDITFAPPFAPTLAHRAPHLHRTCTAPAPHLRLVPLHTAAAALSRRLSAADLELALASGVLDPAEFGGPVLDRCAQPPRREAH
ncbi:hypothetical protein B0H14DRAFT_3720864 [Mycena olivaceomarginata]|nr:hypothetical protein B0H14DRAFT_3720864 [Mycena olivaceomarginata]